MTRVSTSEIGRRLSEFIEAKGWTKREFARRMEINPANVSKYLKGDLDVQHIVVPLIANGCDVTSLFFDSPRQANHKLAVLDPESQGRLALDRAFGELLNISSSRNGAVAEDECANMRWLRVNKQNGLSVFPILISGDQVLLCEGAELADGDLVEVKIKNHEPTLKVAYFDNQTVILRSINPMVRPVAATKGDVLLSKVVLVKKK